MIRASRLPALLLTAVLFVACAVAFIGVDCGSDTDCAASKFALGYLLLGFVVAFTGSVVSSVRTLITRLVFTPFSVLSRVPAFLKISARAPPALL